MCKPFLIMHQNCIYLKYYFEFLPKILSSIKNDEDLSVSIYHYDNSVCVSHLGNILISESKLLHCNGLENSLSLVKH